MQNKATILAEALPYIQKYNGKVIVIKYGGNAMTTAALKQAVMSDIVLLSLIGIKTVLVHGGGPEITETLTQMGIESTFVGGLRVTDKQTADVVQMVLAGKTNKSLVSLLSQNGGKAIGLCGIDGDMIRAKKRKGTPDLGYVGDIVGIHTEPIQMALDSGYIPVIATVGCNDKGDVFNINADTAAAQIAAALQAENLLLMTDTRGLLRDIDDEASLIPVVQVSEVAALKRQGIITGGMVPKIDCCVEAVRRGVKKTCILDGRMEHAILMEILSDEGIGTMFI